MNPTEIKTFCKIVNQARHDGILSRQQANTLTGQAKHVSLESAKKGLLTIMKEVQ